MEKDMERWLKQRESLRKKLDKFTKKKQNATSENAVCSLFLVVVVLSKWGKVHIFVSACFVCICIPIFI